jgi:hypothetical protein
MLSAALTPAAAVFTATASKQGLQLDGWFIDLATDSAAQIVLGRGAIPSTTVTVIANGTNAASQVSWPGFSAQHGFTATLPYVGAPGATNLCAWRAPAAGTALGTPLQCFSYQEQPAAFADARITRGTPLHVSLRNVPSRAQVSINLRAAPGYFMREWTNIAIWGGAADAAGSLDASIATEQLPPGSYVVAYHCVPECPGGSLNASQLKGGQPWTGSITLGPSVAIIPSVTRQLAARMNGKTTVRVVGGGFRARESVGVIVAPPLINFEGFPREPAGVAYTKADTKGAFTVDVDVTGLPLGGARNQVVVLDSSRQPVAAILFTAP